MFVDPYFLVVPDLLHAVSIFNVRLVFMCCSVMNPFRFSFFLLYSQRGNQKGSRFTNIVFLGEGGVKKKCISLFYSCILSKRLFCIYSLSKKTYHGDIRKPQTES